MAFYDGYQVFRVDETTGSLLAVSACRGSYREAFEDKLHSCTIDPCGKYEIHGIINANNNK